MRADGYVTCPCPSHLACLNDSLLLPPWQTAGALVAGVLRAGEDVGDGHAKRGGRAWAGQAVVAAGARRLRVWLGEAPLTVAPPPLSDPPHPSGLIPTADALRGPFHCPDSDQMKILGLPLSSPSLSLGHSRSRTQNVDVGDNGVWTLQACKGFAPEYTEAQKADLRAVLAAARQLFQEAFEPCLDSRIGQRRALRYPPSHHPGTPLQAGSLLPSRSSPVLPVRGDTCFRRHHAAIPLVVWAASLGRRTCCKALTAGGAPPHMRAHLLARKDCKRECSQSKILLVFIKAYSSLL